LKIPKYSRGSPTGVKSSESYVRFSSLGFWYWEVESTENLALKAIRALAQIFHRTWGIETPILECAYRISYALSPRAKQGFHI